MAGGKVITLAAGASESRRVPKAEPLAESIDRFPIWVHMKDAGHVKGVFRFLREELDRAGFRCDGDLQTDPHDRLKIEAFFEIFLHVDQKRAPENFGIVTLYSDANGNLAIKMSPCFPEACNDFRAALSIALQRQLSIAGGGGTINMDITIRQQNDYRPIDARGADEAPKTA